MFTQVVSDSVTKFNSLPLTNFTPIRNSRCRKCPGRCSCYRILRGVKEGQKTSYALHKWLIKVRRRSNLYDVKDQLRCLVKRGYLERKFSHLTAYEYDPSFGIKTEPCYDEEANIDDSGRVYDKNGNPIPVMRYSLNERSETFVYNFSKKHINHYGVTKENFNITLKNFKYKDYVKKTLEGIYD